MIIGLVGFIGSGKGTVGSILQHQYSYHTDSFASTLKDVVSVIFGYPRHLLEGDSKESREYRERVDPWWAEKLGIPDWSPRRALQLVGTELFRDHFNRDIWMLSLERRLADNPSANIVITDVRFKNESSLIRKYGGAIIRVRRGPEPEWFDIAKRAGNDDLECRRLMETQYQHIHVTEWEWISMTPDHVIFNDGSIEALEKNVHELLLSGTI